MEHWTRRRWLESTLAVAAGVALGGCAKNAVDPHVVLPRAPASTGLVRLDLNENPFGPSPGAVDAIREQLGTLSRYTSEDAASVLAHQIADLEGVPVEQIVLGEVLEPLGLHIAREKGAGAEIVYSNPGYTALADASRSVGGSAIGVPLDARLENDLGALAARVGERTAAVFLVNPHNPSGTISDPSALGAFVRDGSRRTLVIVDEAYLEYQPDAAARTCAARVRSGDNVVVFRTFSKIHGLAALPMGYAIAPPGLADALKKNGVGHARSLDRLAVAAAGASLRDTSFLEHVRTKVAEERARWTTTLDSLGLRHSDARASFVFFETGRPHATFASAMRAHGVEIGRAFAPLDTWARVSIGLPEENAFAQAALRDVLRGRVRL